MEKNII
jgi:hypothetical protein